MGETGGTKIHGVGYRGGMLPHLQRLLKDRFDPEREGIRTYWWRRAGLIHDWPNFGDELTPQITPEISNVECTWAHPKRSELIGAGSILEMVQAQGAPDGLKVWGSGYILPPKRRRKFNNPDFDFYAVRGRLTLDRICPGRRVVLGDPGLLASRVYPRSPAVPGRIGLVYHHEHKGDHVVRTLARGPVALIDPLRDPKQVVHDITTCEFVFSTSLHGLIVADSFGIPNAWVSLKKKLVGGRYKFEDYYSAFDQEPVQHSASVIGEEAVVHRLREEYRGVPHLDKIQDDLIAAFPFVSTAA